MTAPRQSGVSAGGVLAVMDLYTAELTAALERLVREVASGRVSNYDRELADVDKWRTDAVNARAAVEELLEADTEYELLCSVFPCPEDRVAELIGDLAEYAAKMKASDQRRHVALLRCKGGAA